VVLGEIAATLWVDEELQMSVYLDAIVTVLDGKNLLHQFTQATPNVSHCS